jgi:hypothetical protein
LNVGCFIQIQIELGAGRFAGKGIILLADRARAVGIAAQSRQAATTPPQRSSKIRWLMTLIRDSARRREWLTRRVLGSDYEMLELGRFRRGGEIHQWMYDQYSLSSLLLETGFRNPTLLGPTESHISNWKDFHLDTDADGQVYKPDSMFMEAFK